MLLSGKFVVFPFIYEQDCRCITETTVLINTGNTTLIFFSGPLRKIAKNSQYTDKIASCVNDTEHIQSIKRILKLLTDIVFLKQFDL